MNITTNKQNTANATAIGLIAESLIQSKFTQLSHKAAKTLKVDGFRKGKVPLRIVQSRFGNQLMQDTEQELIKEFIDKAIKNLDITEQQLLGKPTFLKYNKEDKGIDIEIRFAMRPNIDISHINQNVPTFDMPTTNDEEIEQRLQNLAKKFGTNKNVTRVVQMGDIVLIDFEGFISGVAFEGGKAQGYTLEIGSNSFISGFEEQIVGMHNGAEKDIHVTFPQDYNAPHLAGKDAVFHIKLHQVQERESIAIDDELAKKVLTEEENPTLELLKERIKDQIINEKKSKLYNDELKEKLAISLADALSFDIPENIIEQEIDMLFRDEVNSLTQQELEALENNTEEIKKRREKYRADAQKSVKLTLIIDAIAQEKKISISNQELWQRLYIEALSLRQDPKILLEYYQKNGILPAFQMAILEDKVLTFLLDENNKKEEK